MVKPLELRLLSASPAESEIEMGEVAVPVLFRWEVGGGMGGDVMRAFTLTSRTP